MIEYLCEQACYGENYLCCCTQVMEKEQWRLPLFNDVFFSDRSPPF